MIVNRQLFNYKLIIGTLLIALVVLGSYGFVKYQKLKNYQSFLEHETTLVQNELHEMIKSYDAIQGNNNTLNFELIQTKANLSHVLDSVRLFTADVSVVSMLKKQIALLNKEKSHVFGIYDGVQKQNKSLQKEVAFLTRQTIIQQKQLKTLEDKNDVLSKTIKKIQSVSAINIQAIALTTNNSRKDTKTTSIDKLEHIEVCLTLLSSEFTPKGNKNLYVQILGPDKQLIAERGRVNYKNASLSYSGMTVVNTDSTKADVCVKINIETKKLLNKGAYSIRVYNDDIEIGSTELKLN
ncbi:MAG: hypothetical protein ABI295_11965 [Xanthomarina sp.]